MRENWGLSGERFFQKSQGNLHFRPAVIVPYFNSRLNNPYYLLIVHALSIQTNTLPIRFMQTGGMEPGDLLFKENGHSLNENTSLLLISLSCSHFIVIWIISAEHAQTSWPVMRCLGLLPQDRKTECPIWETGFVFGDSHAFIHKKIRSQILFKSFYLWCWIWTSWVRQATALLQYSPSRGNHQDDLFLHDPRVPL